MKIEEIKQGDRFLYRVQKNSGNIIEATVLEISLSGERAKLQYPNGNTEWIDNQQGMKYWILLEKLNPKPFQSTSTTSENSELSNI